MHFNFQKFSYEMRICAAAYRLNVTNAAKEIGISKATLSRINREIGLPDIETYYKCCKWLKTDMNKFFK